MVYIEDDDDVQRLEKRCALLSNLLGKLCHEVTRNGLKAIISDVPGLGVWWAEYQQKGRIKR